MSSLTTTKPITVGELMAAMATVPSFTPVKCDVRITCYLDEDDRRRGHADFNDVTNVVGVHTALGVVMLEVEE